MRANVVGVCRLWAGSAVGPPQSLRASKLARPLTLPTTFVCPGSYGKSCRWVNSAERQFFP